jgi:uncharacterized protein
MRKRIALKILWYGLSMILFWNVLIAVRAWRFTHFSDVPKTGEAVVNKAGFFSQLADRFKGRTYYKTANTEVPSKPYSTILLKTKKGLKIECWQIPVANARGTVILFHGLQGSKQNMLPEANLLTGMGYQTLLVDFRAHGGSDGYRCTVGADEQEEVKLAMQYLQQTGEKNIILYGASMGAAAVMHALKSYPELQPAKIILDMPFASYERLVEKWFEKSKYPTQPSATLFTFWAGLLNGKSFFKLSPSGYARSIQCPVLMQWGSKDNLVPEKDTRKIFDHIASSSKQFVIYEQCGHESYSVKEKDKWVKTVTAFLQ